MTERHPLLRDPHLETVADCHPVEGMSATDEVAIGCSVGAAIGTRDPVGSGSPEGN